MSKYLDETGVEQVWDAVKNRSVPVKSVTREAYKALSDAEKDADVIWNVTDELPVDERITMDDIEQAIQDALANLDDGVPTGAVVSFMALSAPDGYLICDGTTYNISAYSELANFIKTQFGSFSYFGGNGTSTFAVPDLRNLFLRGYHGNASEQLSGEIGKKQDGTGFPNIYSGRLVAGTGVIGAGMPLSSNLYIFAKNMDTANKSPNMVGAYVTVSADGANAGNNALYYTSRPVNSAVLYCIKT